MIFLSLMYRVWVMIYVSIGIRHPMLNCYKTLIDKLKVQKELDVKGYSSLNRYKSTTRKYYYLEVGTGLK